MGYEGLDDVKNELLPYLKTALEEKKECEKTLFKEITRAYHRYSLRLTTSLEKEYSFSTNKIFKGINQNIEKAIEAHTARLYEELTFIVYQSLLKINIIALSPTLRLKLDEAIWLLNAEKREKHFVDEMLQNNVNVTGETEEKKKRESIRGVMKSIQNDGLTTSQLIAKSAMEKVKVFNNKEFTISNSIWDLTGNNKEAIKEILKSGTNQDVVKTAKMLEKYIIEGKGKTVDKYPNMMARLGSRRVPSNLKFEAFRLARNEVAEMSFRSTLKSYIENPYIEACRWLLANNRLKMYEDKCECNNIAFQDAYGLGRGIYPLDKVPDRPHVMCLCMIAPITGKRLKEATNRGLKIGNVPTKEWQESLAEEINKTIIQNNKSIKGVSIFHNENQEALKGASIEVVKEHKWFTEGVRKEDKKIFIQDLKKVNGNGLYYIARYASNMKVDFYSNRKRSGYDIKENKIYCNLIKDAKRADNKKCGFTLDITTFLHEAGHWLDSNRFEGYLGLTEKMPALFNDLQTDLINKINEVGRKYKKDFIPIKKLDAFTLKNLDKDVKKEISLLIEKNADINSGASDLINALTYGEIKSKYKHDSSYWKFHNEIIYSTKLRAEAIAHMFEVLGSGGDRLKVFNFYFPLSFSYFNEMLEEFF